MPSDAPDEETLNSFASTPALTFEIGDAFENAVKLHQAGPLVQFGLFFWSLEKTAEVLRLECRPAGIRVSCVCPPEVETPAPQPEAKPLAAVPA